MKVDVDMLFVLSYDVVLLSFFFFFYTDSDTQATFILEFSFFLSVVRPAVGLLVGVRS